MLNAFTLIMYPCKNIYNHNNSPHSFCQCFNAKSGEGKHKGGRGRHKSDEAGARPTIRVLLRLSVSPD